MFRKKIINLINLINQIGNRTFKYLLISIFLGVVWFVVESCFVFVLQTFLVSIGILVKGQTFLPDWLPLSIEFSVCFLLVFGILRALVFMLKMHFATMSQLSFTTNIREIIIRNSLKHVNLFPTKVLLSTFSEVTTQAGNVVYSLNNLAISLTSALLFFLYGATLATKEMLLGVFLLFIFMIPLKHISSNISGYGSGLIKEWEALNESLHIGFKNNFFLKVFNLVENENKKSKENLNQFFKHYENYSKSSAFLASFPLLIGIFVLSLITFSSVKYFNTKAINLISFFYLFIRLAQAASDANSTISLFKLNMPGFIKIADLLEKFNNVEKLESRTEKLNLDKGFSIHLNNVSFEYDNQQSLIQDLNLELNPGDVLIIKGESGSGKSTLLSILLGILKPTAGVVKYAEVDILNKDINFSKILGYVGPEPYLLNDTLYANLTYGSDEVLSEDEIWNVLRSLKLEGVIIGKKNKLDEFLTESAQFSTGQKQRISLARAMLKKPYLLVFDEATANLDDHTEKVVIDSLSRVVHECITVIVTHKNSFDRVGSKFIYLNQK